MDDAVAICVVCGLTVAGAIQMSVMPNVVSYSTVIDGFVKKLQPREAARWLKKMQEANVKPNVVTYSTVVNAFTKTNNPEVRGMVHSSHSQFCMATGSSTLARSHA